MFQPQKAFARVAPDIGEMNVVSRVFRSFDQTYLIRCYVIGAAFAALFIGVHFLPRETPQAMTVGDFLYPAVCLVFFPFAKRMYDTGRAFALGNNAFAFPIVIFMSAKILINCVLFALSPVIGPVAIAYLAYRTRPAI
ncbi:hypothetical protein RBI14_22345 [Alcaligenaceae bacterium B3P038]|nr:hypothetical protein [Alcaligenaceae bacterium B3P038]